MQLDEHTMTVMTGLVFAVVLGTMAQNSDTIVAQFSPDDSVSIEDDVFFVRSGTSPVLDVLANDTRSLTGSDITLVSQPHCGALALEQTGVSVDLPQGCTGELKFAYCVGKAGDCAPAQVTVNVMPARDIADAYIPAQGEVVPLPTKFADLRSERDVPAIKAFVVEFEAAEQEDKFGDIRKFAFDTAALDLSRGAEAAQPGAIMLSSIDAPLDASRSARLLIDGKKSASSFAPVSAQVETASVDTEEVFIEFINDDPNAAAILIDQADIEDASAQIDGPVIEIN